MIYGHPSADVYKLSNQSSFLDGLFTELSTLPITDVNSPIVKKELEEVKGLNDILVKDQFILRRFRMYDKEFYRHIYNIKFVDDEETTVAYQALIRSLFNDVVPLVHKLKLHYQRPRPFQLAALHHVLLYPDLSWSAQCPAFPSMHACMGSIIGHVCVNTFPQTIRYFTDMKQELSHSRVQLGHCLPSDVTAGHIVAERIMQEKEFNIKYRM